MRNRVLNREIGIWEADDRIRATLKINVPILRELDCRFVERVLGWKNIKVDRASDFAGTDLSGIRRMVPAFSYREALTQTVVSRLLLENPFLRTKQDVGRWKGDGHFFGWTAALPGASQFCLVAAYRATTVGEAIARATVCLFEFMDEDDRWRAYRFMNGEDRWQVSRGSEATQVFEFRPKC